MRIDTIVQAFVVAFVPVVGLAALQTVMPVLAPALMQAASMPPAAYGFVAGAMGLGSIWVYMANAAFTNALGPVRALKAATLIAIAGALSAASGTFSFILAGGFLIGFGYATTTPAGSQILADHTPRQRHGMLFSLRQAGVPLGGVIAGMVGSWVAAGYGWQYALLGIAGLCAISSVALILSPQAFNESRPRARFRFSGLLALANIASPFRIVGRIPGLRRMALICVGFAAVQGTVNAFFVIYATSSLGLSLTLAGTLFATMQAASVAGRVLFGFVADWVGSTRTVLRGLAVMSCLSGLLLASLSENLSTVQLYAALVFVGLSVATWNGLYLAEIVSIARDAVSEATAGVTYFVFLTYMVTPPIMGLIITAFGYRPIFIVAAACAAFSGGVLMLPAEREPGT